MGSVGWGSNLALEPAGYFPAKELLYDLADFAKEVSGFRRRPRPEVGNRTMLTPEAADIEKLALGAVSLLLCDLVLRKHLQQ